MRGARERERESELFKSKLFMLYINSSLLFDTSQISLCILFQISCKFGIINEKSDMFKMCKFSWANVFFFYPHRFVVVWIELVAFSIIHLFFSLYAFSISTSPRTKIKIESKSTFKLAFYVAVFNRRERFRNDIALSVITSSCYHFLIKSAAKRSSTSKRTGSFLVLFALCLFPYGFTCEVAREYLGSTVFICFLKYFVLFIQSAFATYRR